MTHDTSDAPPEYGSGEAPAPARDAALTTNPTATHGDSITDDRVTGGER